MIFNREILKDYDKSSNYEWLIGNGLGGYASSTIIGVNTRKYHGLLVAALNPPVQRVLILSTTLEQVTISNKTYELSANKYPNAVSPKGFSFLQNFYMDPFPVFIYSINGILIEKTIFTIYGENQVIIQYRILGDFTGNINFSISPLVNCRDFHGETRESEWLFCKKERIINNKTVEIKAYKSAPSLFIGCSRGFYKSERVWYKNFEYDKEKYRGLNCREDHYKCGTFNFSLSSKENLCCFIGGLTEPFRYDSEKMLRQQKHRLKKVFNNLKNRDNTIEKLLFAADSFIVKRKSTGKKSILAGYHWFSDWGRDTMVSLPGLTLVTGRFDDAREILLTFAENCKKGLIPNRFSDYGELPAYNTVDASLWFFVAVYEFLRYTGDFSFIEKNIYKTLKEIVHFYLNGTDYGIKADTDGLINIPGGEFQLTWMDAKVNDWIVTPRFGKPVEINSLWYNALKILDLLSEKFEDNINYSCLISRVKSNFNTKFWNKEKECYYDVISDVKDSSVRPNQIFSVSLPFVIAEDDYAEKTVKKVLQELYTTYGLRSLSKLDSSFIGNYGGNLETRDAAYHQGTVWAWLIGPFMRAYLKVNRHSKKSKEFVKTAFKAFEGHLDEHGLNSISEIFDGDAPFTPRGCISQAWSVGECLRIYIEEIKERKPEFNFD